jgi:nucleotide-binding universal stress UspA family protein
LLLEAGCVLGKILVALDHSDLSERVIAMLNQLQLQPTTEVLFAHVVAPVEVGEEPPADQPGQEPLLGLYRHIEEKVEVYQAKLPCPSKLEIVAGDPAEEIVRLANIHHVHLIVLGCRGLTGVNRILKGSVSSQVVADATCSVMVVR